MEMKRGGDHGWGRYIFAFFFEYFYTFEFVHGPPKKWVLEDDFSYLLWSFLGSMLNFGGVPTS